MISPQSLPRIQQYAFPGNVCLSLADTSRQKQAFSGVSKEFQKHNKQNTSKPQHQRQRQHQLQHQHDHYDDLSNNQHDQQIPYATAEASASEEVVQTQSVRNVENLVVFTARSATAVGFRHRANSNHDTTRDATTANVPAWKYTGGSTHGSRGIKRSVAHHQWEASTQIIILRVERTSGMKVHEKRLMYCGGLLSLNPKPQALNSLLCLVWRSYEPTVDGNR